MMMTNNVRKVCALTLEQQVDLMYSLEREDSIFVQDLLGLTRPPSWCQAAEIWCAVVDLPYHAENPAPEPKGILL